jgi:hypothetical protein
MKENYQTKNMKTLCLEKSITRSPLRIGFILCAVLLACFARPSTVRALLPPPAPDGGYPGGNTAEGQNALFSLTTGANNTALGFDALWHNTTGSYNTATGEQTLYLNVSGNYNTGTGYRALSSNTGSKNTADGYRALYLNTTGDQNTAEGFQALYSNTSGFQNTANGLDALYSNTDGGANTATGVFALFHNTRGDDNTANGYQALQQNTIGGNNTANGEAALYNNTTGFDNTANGLGALYSNTTGDFNTANGDFALSQNTTGSYNIALGYSAGNNITMGSNNIAIGSYGRRVDESNTISIGVEGTQTATFIAGIANAMVTGSAVYVDTTTGKLGLLSSSERFKDGIKPMDRASEVVLALKPVTFHYKKEIDPKGIPQFGLVAEQVEKVNPALVARDAQGKVYTVRYEAVNAMLLNEFLKEHQKVQALEKQVEKLTAGLQKVSAQLEASKPAPQVVNNP